MPVIGKLIRRRDGVTLLARVVWCDSFGCRLRGLMFRRRLPADEGLLLVEDRTSRSSAAIHMLFMRFPIAAIWLDDGFRVVDAVHARPWRPVYVPSQAARYTLEANPDLLATVEIGDELVFERLED